VVAVRTAPEHMQGEIDLRGGAALDRPWQAVRYSRGS
jgi:hypothetical protein